MNIQYLNEPEEQLDDSYVMRPPKLKKRRLDEPIRPEPKPVDPNSLKNFIESSKLYFLKREESCEE